MPVRARQRPRIVTWLALLVLLIGVANLLGAYGLLGRWRVLIGAELSLSPWGLLIPAAVWGVGWGVLAWGLWTLRPWARRATLLAFPLYELMLIGRRLVFAQSVYARGRLPCAAGLGLLATVLVITVLTRPRVRRAFDQRSTESHRTIHQETETQ